MAGTDVAQAAVGLAALLISLFTFVLASNDRRHRDNLDELRLLRSENDRLQKENDDLERKYYQVLDELHRANNRSTP